MLHQSMLREKLGLIFITFILTLSLLFFDASKYDTATHIWFSLLLGMAIIAIPILFTTDSLRKLPALLLGVWIALLWISFAFSQTKNYGFSEMIVLTFAVLLGISANSISEKPRRILIYIFIGAAIASTLWGFWYFPTHGEPRMAGLFLDWRDPRHFFPNAFATFLLMVWPLIFRPSRSEAKPLMRPEGATFTGIMSARKWWRILAVALLLAALYLTFSRAAWIVFIAQICLLLFYYRAKIIKPLAISGLIALFLVIALQQLRALNFSTISLKERVAFAQNQTSTSVNERKDFWIGALKLAVEKPLTGFGPMSFRYVYPQLQKKFLAISDHPHNWFLKMAAENGIPAALLFIGILAFTFITAEKSREKISNAPIVIAVTGGILHNMLDYNMNFAVTIVIFFILLGMLLQEVAPTSRRGINCLAELRLGLTEKKQKASGKVNFGLWIILIVLVVILSGSELFLKLQKRPLSLASRDYFRSEAEKSLKIGEKEEAMKLLDIHLSKNPHDAQAWYLKGNYQNAVMNDPMNWFRYYKVAATEGVKDLLKEYDALLINNIHYTAFTDNPSEAARLWRQLGRYKKAKEIEQLAAKIRGEYAKANHFNKSFGPRTPVEIVLKLALDKR